MRIDSLFFAEFSQSTIFGNSFCNFFGSSSGNSFFPIPIFFIVLHLLIAIAIVSKQINIDRHRKSQLFLFEIQESSVTFRNLSGSLGNHFGNFLKNSFVNSSIKSTWYDRVSFSKYCRKNFQWKIWIHFLRNLSAMLAIFKDLPIFLILTGKSSTYLLRMNSYRWNPSHIFRNSRRDSIRYSHRELAWDFFRNNLRFFPLAGNQSINFPEPTEIWFSRFVLLNTLARVSTNLHLEETLEKFLKDFLKDFFEKIPERFPARFHRVISEAIPCNNGTYP